jgi:hypothetical protein
MFFKTTLLFLTLLILRFSSAKPPLHTWKIKHGSNVGITLGTVIIYNILQHYSISITTLIVSLHSIPFYFFFVTLYCSFSFYIFTSICSYLALSLLIYHFPSFALILFSFLFHYRSVITVPVTFPVYIRKKEKKNLTLITLGCEGRLPMARFAPSPVPLSSCCTPSA